jgi:hypothetical protein
MPKVVDAARVTIPTNTIWRTCTGCAVLAPLAPDTNRCTDCTAAPPLADPAAQAWQRINRYAQTIGRIEAWATMPGDITDAARLAKIRDAVTALKAELGWA